MYNGKDLVPEFLDFVCTVFTVCICELSGSKLLILVLQLCFWE